MGDVGDKHHQVLWNGENVQTLSRGRWLKARIALVTGCCLALTFTIVARGFGVTDGKESANMVSLVNANKRPAMSLYFKRPLQLRRGAFQSFHERVRSSWPWSLQFLPRSPRSWPESPGFSHFLPSPVQSWPAPFHPPLAPVHATAEKAQNVDGRVVVVGAGGRTGRMVVEKLLTTGRTVTGLVRTEDKASQLAESLSNSLIMPTDTGAPVSPETCSESVAVADILNADSIESQLSGATTVIVCSSATPQIKKRSLIPFMLKRLVTLGKKGRPSFKFPPNGTPEEVDYVGVKNIIQAAKKAKIKRVVLVGSMGGTQKENFLNTIGEDKDGKQGNILVWKRKAEMELISSGLEYTIIHPGGLLDKEGGKRELILGIDDELLNTTTRSVPRADVAAMAVQCIDCPAAKNCAFDMASLPEEEGSGPTADLCALVGSLGSKTCNYKINVPP